MQYYKEDFPVINAGAFVDMLDLSGMKPSRIDMQGEGTLTGPIVGAKYFKNEDGAYALISVSWYYVSKSDQSRACSDSVFYVGTAKGVKTVEWEEWIALGGKELHPNKPGENYDLPK